MNTLIILIPIIVALISGFFGQPLVQLVNSYQRKRLKNLLIIIESRDLINHFSDDFKRDFINPDLEENYFYVQTGIKTNQVSIKRYIHLKNRLGNNITWEVIKNAKPHLKNEEDRLIVSVNRFERVYKNFILIVSLILFLMSLGVAIYASQVGVKSITESVALFVFVFVPLVSGYFILNSVQSLMSASFIERQLQL